MRKVALILALIALVASQEVVVENWTGQYNTGERITKTFTNSAWNNVLDFAVYGWFKINSALPRSAWSTIFHFTSNDANFSNASKSGDRVLSFFLINDVLHTPTYTTFNSNYYTDLAFDNNDLDKWAFFYVAYGASQQRRFAYFDLPSSGVKQNTLGNILHDSSSFYRIFVGQSCEFKYFPGSLYRVTIHGGAGAYRETGFSALQTPNPNTPVPPPPVIPPTPTCPQIYTECSYGGVATDLCESKPQYDVRTIKSIFLPAGYSVTVHDQVNYAGKKVTYNTSIECITEFNWSFLIDSKAITITEEKTHLKRNSSKRHH